MKTMTATRKTHKFEQADLGKAPYQLTSVEYRETGCGSACDYCGTYIVNIFKVESSDGRRFQIGSTCVESLGDAGLTKVVNQSIQAHRRELREAKYRAMMQPVWAKEREEAAKAAQNRLSEYNRVKPLLATQPHPNEYFASQGKTKLDYLMYFVGNRDDADIPELIRLNSKVYWILKDAGANI